MLSFYYSSQFRKDYKLIVKRGYNCEKLDEVLQLLINGFSLQERYRDHLLMNSKKYKNVRECHIALD